MAFDVITIFPDMVRAMLSEGVVGRAVGAGLVTVGVHDLRAFTDDRHRTVDDVPFGGGPGMVMLAEPIARAVEAVAASRGERGLVVVTSAAGRQFDQAAAQRMAAAPQVTWVCGRYEGIDARVVDELGAEEWSLGDFVLSGGELAAVAMLDAAARLMPGVLGDARSVDEESFAEGMLEYPHYTRPATWRGRRVPDVLVSGHHAAIAQWRREAARIRTEAMRPDLVSRLGQGRKEQ